SEQAFIETSLARRHLKNGMLVLYDVTSTYLEGRCCPLARHGYSRDSRGDRPQLVIGLLCAADGCPAAVEVFEGNPDYPDERLVVCKNPLLAEERRRKRDELLALTEADLSKIQARVVREKQPLRGAGAIGKAVGAVMGKRKMAKHFELTISDEAFSFTRKTEAIADEARFDGFYVLRTSLSAEQADTAATVRAYKSLAQVERAFRCIKTVDLELRPVFHWTAPRVRAHVLLCMLAYYLEWHMRQPLAPMLFDDHDRAIAAAGRASPVAKAKVSKAAYRKASTQRIEAGNGQIQPVHSFRTLLDDLAK